MHAIYRGILRHVAELHGDKVYLKTDNNHEVVTLGDLELVVDPTARQIADAEGRFGPLSCYDADGKPFGVFWANPDTAAEAQVDALRPNPSAKFGAKHRPPPAICRTCQLWRDDSEFVCEFIGDHCKFCCRCYPGQPPREFVVSKDVLRKIENDAAQRLWDFCDQHQDCAAQDTIGLPTNRPQLDLGTLRTLAVLLRENASDPRRFVGTFESWTTQPLGGQSPLVDLVLLCLQSTRYETDVEFADAVSAAWEDAQWRPIESAPKDGTEILALSERGLSVAAWHVDWPATGWLPRYDGGLIPIEVLDPTVWMPLPELPLK